MDKLDIIAASRKARTAKQLEVPVPEWGNGTVVHLRMMDLAEREAYEKLNQNGITGDFMSQLLQRTLCDAAGELVFDTLDEVRQIDSVVGARLFWAARDLNRIGMDAVETVSKN